MRQLREILSRMRAADFPAHQRGRAAAEENRFHQRALRALRRCRPVQFFFDGRDPAGFVDGGADMGVEIAIGTFGGAERPVDVNAERPT